MAEDVDEVTLIVMRIAEEPTTPVLAFQQVCSKCRQPCWVSYGTYGQVLKTGAPIRLICTRCVPPQDLLAAGQPTPEQIAEIMAATGDTPEQVLATLRRGIFRDLGVRVRW